MKTKREKIIEAMDFFRKLSVNYGGDEVEYFKLALEALDWKRMLHGSPHDVDEFYRD